MALPPGPRSAGAGPYHTGARAHAAAGPAAGSGAAAGAFLLVLASVTLLQKVGLPAGGGIEVAVLAPWLAAAWLLLRGGLRLSAGRLGLFAVFAVLVLISQAAGRAEFSLSSVLLAFALYAPFCCEAQVEPAVLRRCMEVFVRAMLALADVVVLQDVVQVALSWRAWGDLDRLLPAALQVHGYNYLQPITYGARLYKPNAFFFLEGSFVSQFLALGLIVEASLFGRAWRMAALAIAMLLTFTGSGLLLTALAAPFLLGRLSGRTLLSLGVAGAAVAAAALYLGWFAQMAHRFDEFSTPGSSGYYRYNLPLQIVGQMASDPAYVFTGHGAGATGKAAGQDVEGFILAPWAKLIYEYGFAVCIAFYAFLGYALFRRAPSVPVAAALFVFFTLGGGGFVVPAYVVTLFGLGALLRSEAPATRGAARRPATRLASLRGGSGGVMARP